MDIVSIIKQHYEKVVLGGLLLSFIIALVYLLNIMSDRDVKGENDLKITNTKKYEQTSGQEKKDIRAALGFSDWTVRSDKGFTGYDRPGIVTPRRAVRCSDPVGEESCSKMVVYSQLVAGDHRCPLCGFKLNIPQGLKDYDIAQAQEDGDGDGIPDRWENSYGLASGSAADADGDRDGDHYSNYMEYLCGTDPGDANSIPQMHNLLYMTRLSKAVVLNIALENVSRDTVELVVNRKLQRYKKGDKITLDKSKFTVYGWVKESVDKTSVNNTLTEERYVVQLLPEGGDAPTDIIEVRKGQPTMDTHNQEATLRCVVPQPQPGKKPKTMWSKQGRNSSITIVRVAADGETEESGVFTVKSFGENTVTLSYRGTGSSDSKEKIVTLELLDKTHNPVKHDRMRNAYVEKAQKEQNDNADQFMQPGDEPEVRENFRNRRRSGRN